MGSGIASPESAISFGIHPSKVAEAESLLKKSIDVARGQSAKSLELRAATSLAELWRTHGRRDEARALLEPIATGSRKEPKRPTCRRARDAQSRPALTPHGRVSFRTRLAFISEIIYLLSQNGDRRWGMRNSGLPPPVRV